MLIKSSGITDVGLKRKGNEDSFSTDDDLGLYVVADGMGGHLAGEVASRVAVELINKCFRIWMESGAAEETLYGYPDSSLSRNGNYILSSIRLANRVIHELSLEHEKYHGMGTTVATLAVVPGRIIVANVGDSRIYMIRNGEIERLSKDHTIVAEQVESGIMSREEAEASTLKHILTRNLGSSENVKAEVFEIEPANGDRYLLCSDGVTDLISDEEILRMVTAGDNPEALCRQFIDEALKRGGHDNATLISLFFTGMESPRAGLAENIGVLFADFFTSVQKAIGLFKP